jgi:hypothetical protein
MKFNSHFAYGSLLLVGQSTSFTVNYGPVRTVTNVFQQFRPEDMNPNPPPFPLQTGVPPPPMSSSYLTPPPNQPLVYNNDSPSLALNPDKYRKAQTIFTNSHGRTSLELESDLRPIPFFPLDLVMERIEGSETVRNFKIPNGCERVQYILTTNGRPLEATIELWVGPIRKTHTLEIHSENGLLTPVRGTLKFKKGTEVITIRTSEGGELPVSACVVIPSPDRSKELGMLTENLWKSNPKTKIQGGIIQEGNNKKVHGAVRYFSIPPEAEACHLMFWSRDTGKKSLKATIEVLQGPNNAKQMYNLQVSGGNQPYHCVFETPGGGGVIRLINKKYLEDGLFELIVVPIRYEGETAIQMPGLTSY